MRPVWIALLAAFTALNLYAFAAGQWSGLVIYVQNLGPWGILATADLLIALTVALAFMWRHAQSKNISPLPYVALTLFTGSIGVLVYLIRYWDTDHRPSVALGMAK